MSNYLKGLNKTELKYLADEFGAVPTGTSAKDFIEALVAMSVDDAKAKASLKRRREALEKQDPNYQEGPVAQGEPVMLIRMRRQNPTFQWRDYEFTQTHPYVLMKKTDAEALMTFERGFVQATPQEAREHYGSN